MNLIFFAVFAACACFVNGHYHFYNSLRILESEEQTPSTESWADDENSTGEITSKDHDLDDDLDDDLDQKVEHNLKTHGQDTLGDKAETSTSAQDEVYLEDKHFKYWPQIVIIKPMENRPMTYGLGNLLPNNNMFRPPHGNPNTHGFTTTKVKPSRPTPGRNPNTHGFTTTKFKPSRPTPGMQTQKTIRPSAFTTFSTTPHHSFSTHGPKKVSTTQKDVPDLKPREHETDAEIAKQKAENIESEPVTEARTESSYTDASTESPYTEASTESPYTEASTESPYTEATTESPYTEASTESPDTEANTESPYTEASTESSYTEASPESPDSELITESPETEETAETENHSTENPCTTPSGGNGECISVFDCQVLLALLNKKDRTSQDIDLLKRSQCGYLGNSPAVCCPKQTVTPTQQPQGNCYTPEGKVGQCISLYSCAHLANLLKPPVPSESIAYVQKSKCEGKEQYSVCCGPPPDRTQEPTVAPSGNCDAHMSAYPPDPRTECCGVDSRVGNKIVGGNATTVDQYPWLVMIEYVQGGVTKLLCGGVLISGKYVLTAGHCVAGQVLTIGTPKKVRLGEYNISHEGPDCAPVEAGGEDCTEGVTRILIEKVIPHPQYNPVSALKRNDIALLRLKDVAPFTDFIRPICLPVKDLTEPSNIPTNFSLYAAGWGAVSDRKSYSEVKLHVALPYVSADKCQPVYSYPGRSVPLWKAQMCAGGDKGKDSCKGDSGGPLMYEDGRTYEVIGIVSFGPVPCGMEGVPGVYSKVYEYLDWIRNTIVP